MHRLRGRRRRGRAAAASRIAHGRGTTRRPGRASSAPAPGPIGSRRRRRAADPRIVPFRGAYLRLRPERADLVRASIYPVPDPELPFLGAHLTRGPDGAVLLGPTALIAGARDAYRLGRVRAARPARDARLARHLAPGAALLAHRA